MSKHEMMRVTTVRVLSVAFAIILWFYVITEQNPVVPKDLTIPVRITNLDVLAKNDLVMLDNADAFVVELKLKGKKEILDTVNQNTISAYADISNYAIEGERRIPIIINGMPEGVTITTRSDLNIKVSLDKRVIAQKPIVVNITGNPVGGLANLDPILTPSAVVLTGAESIVQKISVVRVDVDIAGVNANVSRQLPIRVLDEAGKDIAGIQLDTRWVNVTVPVANTKRVPIQLITEGAAGDGYVIADKFAQPREILVTGNQTALDQLTVIYSKSIDINYAVSDFNTAVELELPEGIKVVNANESIKAVFDIQRIITSTIEVNSIEYRNLDQGHMVNDVPGKTIRVIVRGPVDIVDNIGGSLKLYVDLSNAKTGQNNYAIEADKPPLVEILEIVPQSIALDIKARE